METAALKNEAAKNVGRNLTTIDQIYDIFCQTLGSIRGSLGLLLWAWVNYSNMSLDIHAQGISTYLSALWFALICLYRGLSHLNQRQVDGWAPFRLCPENDVIMITGGSNGLGLLLLALFSANGFKTVNLDTEVPRLAVVSSTFLKCDVGNHDEVEQVFRSLKSLPSVLINCAGTVSDSLGSLTSIDSRAIAKVVHTNYLGSIWATQTLLARNKAAKMIVGISSSTALAAPAYAGVYASSKAAVRTFFTSLRYECPGTRILCITPGQFDTAMFRDIPTPSSFWAPVVPTVDLATSIYSAILSGRQGELTMPVYAQLLPYILALPQSIVDLGRRWIGIDSAVVGTGSTGAGRKE